MKSEKNNVRLQAVIDFIKINKIFVAAAIIVGGIILTLNILFPYSGDDWYWATRSFSWSEIVKLNGRYLGSVLSLIITKVRPLRVIVCTIITFAVIYALSLSGYGKRGFYFFAAAALVAALPDAVMNETFAWASGFANYVPSALVVIVYVVIIKGEFSVAPPEYSKQTPYIVAALGVVGALFMETVTIGNVIVGAAVLIYHFIRFQKPSATLIAFLGGAIVGAVLMFINPVYFSIAEGNDPEEYRELGLNISTMATMYFNIFHYHLAYNNFILNAFIVGMFAWMFVKNSVCIKTSAKTAVICCFAVQAVYLLLSGTSFFGIALPARISTYTYFGAIKGIFTFLYCITLVTESVLIPKDFNLKLTCLFTHGAILAYTLPTLAVTPMGGRNFLVAYLLFSFMALRLLSENLQDTEKNENRLLTALFAAVTAVTVAVGAFYICKYAVIRSAYNAREKSVAEQMADGAEEIIISPLPATMKIGVREAEYVHNADPDNEYHVIYFKEYYGIDASVKITIEGVGTFG